MRSLLAGITTRGRAFIAAGIAAGAFGLGLGQRELVSLGGVLILLPLFSALAAGRARYRVRCQRKIEPTRVPAGQAATVTIQLDNVTRLPTGLLLAEDTIPYSLGTRPRFVLDRIEAGGSRRITYRLQSDRRGKFAIGPLNVRVADAFGLVRLGRLVALPGTLVVTPAITTLPWTAFGGTWLKADGSRASTAAAAGEDDVVPRAYRDGDELRRVHWRSTARYGELMVRREEQRWRNRATIFLDTRSRAHMGAGIASSSFEAAVSAAASVGVHISREGLTGQFVTDNATLRGGPLFADALLDSLAVIHPSSSLNLDQAMAELRTAGGVIIAISGRLSAPEARKLAACRTEGSQGLAILLDVATWAAAPQHTDPPVASSNGNPPGDVTDSAAGPPGGRRSAETAAAESILRGAGWRVTVLDAPTPLAVAW